MLTSKSFIFRLFLFVLVLMLAGVSAAVEVPVLQVEIRERATVQKEVILLGDIASFHPKTDPRVRELSDLELGASPYPGQTLSLNSRYLIFRLRANIPQDETLQVKVPETLLVSREAQLVDPAQMKQIFKNHVLDNAPWPSEDITLKTISTPSRLSLPVGRLSWKIREKRPDDYIGHVHLSVTFLIDGKPVRKASLSGRVLVKQKLVRAARNIRAGEMIDTEDITSAEEEITHVPDQGLKAEDIIGKRAIRPIRADQLILAGMIEDPPLVKKGSQVLIKAESDQILITTIGKVLEEGRSGDLIRVVNINSGKEIFARVKSPEVVEVSF
jgi:flagella basal body P-ring formation protein FlgA